MADVDIGAYEYQGPYVGFIRAIGVAVDVIYTPDITALLERDYSLKSLLERKFSLISLLERKFSIKALLERKFSLSSFLERLYEIIAKVNKK